MLHVVAASDVARALAPLKEKAWRRAAASRQHLRHVRQRDQAPLGRTRNRGAPFRPFLPHIPADFFPAEPDDRSTALRADRRFCPGRERAPRARPLLRLRGHRGLYGPAAPGNRRDRRRFERRNIACAQENAAVNGAARCRFIRDMAERAARLAAGKTDLLVIDPPRAGMSADAVAAVRRIRPERIAYVSCNPSTLARDLKGLGGTYRATEVIPFDFFPHTAHFEALALLERA